MAVMADTEPDTKPADMDSEKQPPAAVVTAPTGPAVSSAAVLATDDAPGKKRSGRKPARFWMVIVALSLLAFISSLDAMIMGTALPTITAELGGSSVYVWIANCFVFAASAVQPLVGQLSDLLGRKTPTVACVVLFTVGSGIAGGAVNPAMFIAGRAIQGTGAGGIYVLIDIIACDLVPLRDRGKWLGIINAWAGVAAALGPVLGGVLGQHNWRWIFYMNIPICGLAFFTILLFMHVKSGAPRSTTTLAALDITGNLIFIPSIIAVLLGLVTGGVVHPWSSWRVILPIVLGSLGWALFHLHQHFFAANPGVPSRLFANRTSAAGYLLAFLSSVLLQTAGYFLPVFFQAILGTTVFVSGVNFLPFAIGTLFSAALGGLAMSHFAVYRPIHAASFALSAVGFGLFTLLGPDTPAAAWAWYELLVVLGLGPTISTVLPAILAGLKPGDVAAATAVFSFVKTFGFVWGVSVPSIVFDGVFDGRLEGGGVGDAGLRAQLAGGGAYAFASRAHDVQPTVDPGVWAGVVDVYVESLKAVWWWGVALSILGVLAVGIERHLHLSTELETEYGLQEAEGVSGEKKGVEGLTPGAVESGSGTGSL